MSVFLCFYSPGGLITHNATQPLTAGHPIFYSIVAAAFRAEEQRDPVICLTPLQLILEFSDPTEAATGDVT